METELKIGFYINARIGDTVVAIPAMRAIKQVYPNSSFYLLTNSIGINLCQNLSWIDEAILYQSPNQISSLHLNYLISTNCDKRILSVLQTSNARKIITYRKLHNLFNPRFKTTFISYRCKPQSQKQNALDLVNLIAPQKLKLQDIQEHRLQTLPKHKQHIQSFLDSASQNLPKLMLNPFGFTARENLSLAEYASLAESLLERFCVILPTFGDHSKTILTAFPSQILKHPHFIIFENNEDLLNLVELTSRMDLVISPSTGNIHIADNLGIQSIGLFSQKDTIAWGGGNKMEYVILDRLPREEAIQQTLQKALEFYHQIL